MGEARNAAGEHLEAAELRIKTVEGRPAQAGLRPGRIVYFVAGEVAAGEINRRRADFYPRRADEWPRGAQAHVGNHVTPGDIIPAMVTRVTRVWGGDVVNLKVMLDGNDTYWATSVPFSEAHEPGTWHWIPIPRE